MLKIEQHDDDTVTIEGTRYSAAMFRELGCSFPAIVGQVLRVDKKEDGVVTVTKLPSLVDQVKEVYPIPTGVRATPGLGILVYAVAQATGTMLRNVCSTREVNAMLEQYLEEQEKLPSSPANPMIACALGQG